MQESQASPLSEADERAREFRGAITQKAIGRIRAQPRRDRRVTIAVVVAVLLHAVAGWWFLRRISTSPSVDSDRIVVRLIDVLPAPALPEPSAVPPTQGLAPAIPGLTAASVHRAARSEVSAPLSPSAPALQLLDRTGAIRLPTEIKTNSLATKHDEGIARGRELMRRGHNLLHCRRRDNPRATPEAVANAAGSNRETYLGLFHYPGSDAMLDRMAAAGDVAATREEAADRETAAQKICDETEDQPTSTDGSETN